MTEKEKSINELANILYKDFQKNFKEYLLRTQRVNGFVPIWLGGQTVNGLYFTDNIDEIFTTMN